MNSAHYFPPSHLFVIACRLDVFLSWYKWKRICKISFKLTFSLVLWKHLVCGCKVHLTTLNLCNPINSGRAVPSQGWSPPRLPFVTSSAGFLWTEFLGAAKQRRESSVVASGFHICYLQTTSSCWPNRTVTSSSNRDSLQPSVKQQGRGSTPLNLRPCLSAWKGVDCLLRVRGESLPRVEELEQRWQWCGHWSSVLWWRERAEPEGKAFRSIYIPSFPYEPKEWGREYKWPKWASFAGWLGSALEIEWGLIAKQKLCYCQG